MFIRTGSLASFLGTLACCTAIAACSGAPSTAADGRDGRDGAEGKPGAPGQEGTSGKPGDPGPPGPATPFGKGKIYTISGSIKDIGSHALARSSASCRAPADVVITGGCIVTGGQAVLQSSFPTNADDVQALSTWNCAAQNLNAIEGQTVASYVVCVQP